MPLEPHRTPRMKPHERRRGSTRSLVRLRVEIARRRQRQHMAAEAAATAHGGCIRRRPSAEACGAVGRSPPRSPSVGSSASGSGYASASSQGADHEHLAGGMRGDTPLAKKAHSGRSDVAAKEERRLLVDASDAMAAKGSARGKGGGQGGRGGDSGRVVHWRPPELRSDRR